MIAGRSRLRNQMQMPAGKGVGVAYHAALRPLRRGGDAGEKTGKSVPAAAHHQHIRRFSQRVKPQRGKEPPVLRLCKEKGKRYVPVQRFLHQRRDDAGADILTPDVRGDGDLLAHLAAEGAAAQQMFLLRQQHGTRTVPLVPQSRLRQQCGVGRLPLLGDGLCQDQLTHPRRSDVPRR